MSPKDEHEQIADSRNDSKEAKENPWTLKHLSSYLRRLLSELDDVSRNRLLTGCALTVLAIVGYRKRNLMLQRYIMQWIHRPDYMSATEAPLSLVYRAARRGEIQRALLGSTGIFFLSEGSWRRAILPPNSPHLEKDLLQALSSSCSDVSALPESLSDKLATPALAALPFVYLALLYRMMRNLTGREDMSSKMHHSHETTAATFRDVAGLDTVLTEVSEVVSYLDDPDRYTRLGAKAPRGVLLHGPPGSGKTLLARAVAGEAAVDCFLACSASDFVELYVGRGAARVRSLFQQVRQQARNKATGSWWWWWWRRWILSDGHSTESRRKATAILFIDELDALAKTRSSFHSNDEREQTLNQLLTEMDGFSTTTEEDGVTLIVMAASNRADILDPAVLRRFDRQVYVGYPEDAASRCAILQVHARRLSLDRATVDFQALASEEKTGGFSGADCRNLCNEAALLAVRDQSSVVEQRHLEHAARRIRQMKNSLNGPNTEQLAALLR